MLLLDEPFSALDAPVRLELRRELRRLQRETGLATVLVTHDPAEAAFLSDELMVIADGALLQSGPSRSVFARPVSPRVAQFVGVENLNAGTLSSPTSMRFNGSTVGVKATDIPVGSRVQWSVRPELVTVSPVGVGASGGESSALVGTLTDVADSGTAYDLFLESRWGRRDSGPNVGSPRRRGGGDRRVELAPEAIAIWPASEEATKTVGLTVEPSG